MMNGYTVTIILIAIVLTLYTTYKDMPEWKKITIFTLMMVSFPQISFDYTLILLIIPIIAFVKDKNTKMWEDIVYSILFGLLLIPMNINEEILFSYIAPNIGLLLKPLIIILIISIIIISNLNIEKKVRKENYIEA